MQSTRVSSLIVLLLLAVPAWGRTDVLAGERPADANRQASLTPDEVRRIVAEHRGRHLRLAITSLDAETARELVAFPGQVALPHVTTLDAETAAVIAKFQGAALWLGSPAGRVGIDVVRNPRGLYLEGIEALDVPTAAALATYAGPMLSCRSVSTIDAAAARALAGFKGECLFLTGLQELDAEAAEALAEYSGRLGVPDSVRNAFLAAHPLTPQTARAWAVFCRGRIPDIIALESPDSIAIAETLAACPGPLSLPNLCKLSPKTLAALAQKEDLDIPDIDSLQLISEPDGSPNDDVVIPQSLVDRQRQQRAKRGTTRELMEPVFINKRAR